MKRTFEERKDYLKQNKICFSCCRSSNHIKRKCKVRLKCNKCGSTYHCTAMHPPHRDKNENPDSRDSVHGGESRTDISLPTMQHSPGVFGIENRQVNSKCTKICGEGFHGRSCAKILLVKIYHRNRPNEAARTYAMLDEHCNRTLVSTELLDTLVVNGPEVHYTLSSCSGSYIMSGRLID
jgi:hypothetical protein